MSELSAALGKIAEALGKRGVPFAVVGGLAVSARTEPRFTRDIDICAAVADDGAAERLVAALLREGWRVAAQIEHEATGRLSMLRLLPVRSAGTGLTVDLLFASSGVEDRIVAAAEPIPLLGGLRVPVATLAHLIALKVLSRDDRTRPQDRVDLVHMLRAAGPREIEEARSALRLIHERGYDRGRDLPASLDALLTDLRAP